MDLPPPPPPPPAEQPADGGLPYPLFPPTEKSDLPEVGPGAVGNILPRIAARLLDGLIISVPLLLYSQRYVETVGDEFVDDRPGWLIVLTVLAPLVYEIAFLTWRGQTLGKMALNLKVVGYQRGDPVLAAQAALRTIVPNAPGIIALAVPAGLGTVLSFVGIFLYLSAVFDPIYRGIPDKAAGTIVLRTK